MSNPYTSCPTKYIHKFKPKIKLEPPLQNECE